MCIYITKNKLTDTENRLMAARGWGWRVEEMEGLVLFLNIEEKAAQRCKAIIWIDFEICNCFWVTIFK